MSSCSWKEAILKAMTAAPSISAIAEDSGARRKSRDRDCQETVTQSATTGRVWVKIHPRYHEAAAFPVAQKRYQPASLGPDPSLGLLYRVMGTRSITMK